MKNMIFYPVRDENGGNWTTLTQNFRVKSFIPTLTGFTGISSSACFYVLMGPIVYITIYLNGSVSWSSNATIEVPIQPHTPTTGSFPQELDPVIDLGDMTDTGEHPTVTKTLNKKSGLITLSSSGSASSAKITGFYLRN